MLRPVLVALVIATSGSGEPKTAIEFAELPINDLIAAVPPAGQRFQWNADASRWVQDPASVELHKRIIRGKLKDEHWVKLLTTKGVFQTREWWPTSVTFAVGMTYPRWLGDRGEIKATPRIPYPMEARVNGVGGCAGVTQIRRRREQYQEVGLLRPDTTKVTFDVRVLRRGWQLWKGSIDLPVRAVETIPMASAVVDGVELEKAIRDSIIARVRHTRSGEPYLVVWVAFDDLRHRYPDVALGVRFTLLLDRAAVVGRAELPGAQVAFERIRLDQVQVEDVSFQERLVLRVSGDARLALRDLRRSRYWDGEFSVPLKEILLSD